MGKNSKAFEESDIIIKVDENYLEDYYNSIKGKFKKIRFYEKINFFSGLILILSGFGLLPAILLNKINYSIEYSQYQPFIFLGSWFIIASIEVYIISYVSKKIDRMPYQKVEGLFYYTYSAYQNIKSHTRSDNFDLLKKASKLLKNREFTELEDKITNAYDIPGIDTVNLSIINNYLEIINQEVIPRLIEGRDIKSILPIIYNYSLFLYYKKNKDGNVPDELEDKLYLQINDLKTQLKPIISTRKKFIHLFLSKTYKSEKNIRIFLSYSFTVILFYGITFLITKIYYPSMLTNEIIFGGIFTMIPAALGIGFQMMKKTK